MLLAGQPVHQRFVQPGPLVLGSTLLKSPTPTADRDRTVSRRSEPRSRTALMGEQPNPWDLLQPQDATIRHRAYFHRSRWRRLYLHLLESRAKGRRVIALIDLRARSAQQLLSHRSHRMDQSLRGHTQIALAWTSHGIVPHSSCVGVHRYKPELLSTDFQPHYTPDVEVPNLPVDVDSWGR